MQLLIQTDQTSYLQEGQSQAYGKQNWDLKCPYHEKLEAHGMFGFPRPAVTNNDKIVDSFPFATLFDGNRRMTFV